VTATKQPVEWWRWPIWWATLLFADFLFYVLITPVWIGLRGLAWVAEFRARRRNKARRRARSRDYFPVETQFRWRFEYSCWR
jgi:hypothetical protein